MLDSVLNAATRPLRTQPLAGLEEFRGERNLFISAFPRSGNTWITNLLAFCLNCYSVPLDGDGSGFSQEWESLGKYLSGENEHQGSGRFDRVLKTHAIPREVPMGADDAGVYIVRDGRDAITSYYFQIEKQWRLASDAKKRLVIRALDIVPFRMRFDIIARVLGNQWDREATSALTERWHIMRYEDMHRDAFGTLREALEKIDPSAWDEDVARQGIEIFSFGNMRAEAMKSAPDSFSVRKGEVGDWRNNFSPSAARRFNGEHGDTLRRFGYTVESN